MFSPEQLYAMLLTELKGIAETGLGKGVQDCVISVSRCLEITLKFVKAVLPNHCCWLHGRKKAF